MREFRACQWPHVPTQHKQFALAQSCEAAKCLYALLCAASLLLQTFQDYPQLFMFGMLTAETGAMVSHAIQMG
jgi:hypothetical protein